MITIVFTSSGKLLSRLILWLTRGKVSHTFIEYPSALWGGLWVAEAGSMGVRKVPAKRAKKHKKIIAAFQCDFESEAALREVSRYVGVHYDFGGLFVFAWAILLWRVFRRKLKKPLNNTNGQFCSEFVTRFLQEAGVFPSHKDPELVSPQNLLNFCQKSDKFTQI